MRIRVRVWVRTVYFQQQQKRYDQMRVYTVGYAEIGQNTRTSAYIRVHFYILNKSIKEDILLDFNIAFFGTKNKFPLFSAKS